MSSEAQATPTCTECGNCPGVYPTVVNGKDVEYCKNCMLAVLSEELAGVGA